MANGAKQIKKFKAAAEGRWAPTTPLGLIREAQFWVDDDNPRSEAVKLAEIVTVYEVIGAYLLHHNIEPQWDEWSVDGYYEDITSLRSAWLAVVDVAFPYADCEPQCYDLINQWHAAQKLLKAANKAAAKEA